MQSVIRACGSAQKVLFATGPLKFSFHRSMASSSASAAGPVQQLMQTQLTEAFAPSALEIENESYKHSVPKGSESHFKVFIVSDKFEGVKLLQRHRMVNAAVADLLESKVHALSIKAKTPSQAAAGGATIQTTPNCKGGAGK